MTQAALVSIQVGMPQQRMSVSAAGKAMLWSTGIYKSPVEGRVFLGFLNLEGDGQADLSVHGGRNKAVMVYSADHYPLWRAELPDVDFSGYGAFGENFTVSGMTEDNVCLGDIYQIGDAIVQVTQPRQPCWKLAQRLQTRTIGALVIKSGRSGWYLGVMQEGYVEAGQTFTLLERSYPDWTITYANAEMYRE
ncbi:MAG: MOSC domain-containing protein [Anaerolineae bacterium]